MNEALLIWVWLLVRRLVCFTWKKFRKKPLNQNRLTLMYICLILIMLAFDTETNPGPNTSLNETVRSDLCGICSEIVGWHPDRGIYCEECSTWYHAQCQGMGTFMYEFHGEHSNEIWQCFKCGTPNFASTLFESSSIADSDCSISSITAISIDTSSIQSPTAITKHPLHSSTPSGKSVKPLTSTRLNRLPTHSVKKQNVHHLKIITVNCQ